MPAPAAAKTTQRGFRFCGACGADLTANPASAHEVRKVVTVLFCDVAGYTSGGEGLDPEGEVVAGSGDALVTGDAVSLPARLEQAAASGEILLGEETQQLCRDALRAEPVEPLALKGKAEPVAAFRLLKLLDGAAAFARRFDGPFVGRENELAQMHACLEKAIADLSAGLARAAVRHERQGAVRCART